MIKAKQSIIAAILVFLLSVVFGQGNVLLSKPEFSHSRGFYEAPFDVVLTAAPGAGIWFTTDGSTPSESSGTLYSEPVSVETTTPLRAIAIANGLSSPVVTHTYIFLDDVVDQQGQPAGYPNEFAAADDNGPYPADYDVDPEVVNNPKYSGIMDEVLTSVPTMSLVTDIESLFDEASGVYYNPNMKGFEWERQGNIELLDPSGKSVEFSANMGFRMHGQASRRPKRMPKKNFRLYFKAIYGTSKLEFPLFEQGEGNYAPVTKFDRLVLKNGGNRSFPYWDKDQRREADYMNDEWGRRAHQAMGGLTCHGTYVHLYINGLYWGMYNLAERPDAKFYASYLGGNEDTDFDVIVADEDIDDLPAASAGDITLYNQLIAAVNNDALRIEDERTSLEIDEAEDDEELGIITIDERNEKIAIAAARLRAEVNRNPLSDADLSLIETMVDLENLADYMIHAHYIGKTDWAHHNWNVYRKRVGPDTRFRFSAWDNDSGVNKLNQDTTWKDDGDSPSRVYFRCLTNVEFRMIVGDRIQKHLFHGGALSPERGAARYAKLAGIIDKAVIGESARWGDYSRDVYERVDAPPAKVGPSYLYSRDMSLEEADEGDLVPDDVQKNWVQLRAENLYGYFPNRWKVFLDQYRSEGWYDDSLKAPEFSQYGGEVSSGLLQMSNPNGSGDLYFTLDGSDPRLAGGSLNTVATNGGNTFEIPVTDIVTVKARIYDGGQWSYLQEFVYQPPLTSYGLVINEINYKSGPIDAGDWVEIYNPGSSPVTLTGWSLRDSNPANIYSIPDGTVIPGGGYQVFARNLASFGAWFPSISGVLGTWSFGLGGSDSVLLVNASGTVVDEVNYQSDAPWPQTADGFGPTLCLTNPLSDNQLPGNWEASPEIGGTPGAFNGKGSAYPPVVHFVSPEASAIVYDDQLPIAVEAEASATLGGIANVEFFANGYSIGVDTTAPYEVSWVPSVSGYVLKAVATDTQGEVAETMISVGVSSVPTGDPIYLEEDAILTIEAENFDRKTAGRNDAEWLPTTEEVGFQGAGAMQVPSGQTTEVDRLDRSPMLEYDVHFDNPGLYYFWVRAFGATNGDDSCHVGIDGEVQATVNMRERGAWAWRGQPVLVTSSGVKTINIWMREDGLMVDRFVLTFSSEEPTGVGPNESPKGGGEMVNMPPMVEVTGLRSLVPNGERQTITATASDNGNVAEVHFFIGSQFVGSDDTAPYEISWTPDSPGVYDVIAVAIDNESAMVASNAEMVEVIDAPAITELVINEINYEDSIFQATGDWVEIYNPTNGDIDVSGWVVTDDNPANRFEIPSGTTIFANGYLVVAKSAGAVVAAHPGATNVVGNFTFGFGNNAGDSVRLWDQFERLVDEVSYLSTAPWPEEANGTGATLCLSDPSYDNQIPQSWLYSIDGGTPGELNDKANVPPSVTLMSPANGDSFGSGEVIPFTADASDDGSITRVEFYADGILIGYDETAPYSLDEVLPDGSFSISAVAVDNEAATMESAVALVHAGAIVPVSTLPAPCIEFSEDRTQFTIGWTAVLGFTYDVEASPNLVDWDPVAGQTGLSGDNETLEFEATVTDEIRFFRIKQTGLPLE